MAVQVQATPPGQYRLVLRAEHIVTVTPGMDFTGIVDEQLDAGDPPAGKPVTGWKATPAHDRKFPVQAVIDLGKVEALATLWIFDSNNTGDMGIYSGQPDAWQEVATYDCKMYQGWATVPLDITTRYLMLELKSAGAIFNEIVLDAYSSRGWEAVKLAKAESERKEAERAAALKLAREEALKRPLTELAPFGTLSLVDEVDCGAVDPAHMMRSDPADAVRKETILGRPCRVLSHTAGECAYMSFRLGYRKLLRPGAAYVLAPPSDDPYGGLV